MYAPAGKQWTLEDLDALPEDGNRYEISGGLLLSEPSGGGGQHGRLTARISLLVSDYVDRHRLGQTFSSEASYVLARRPDTVRAPDLSFIAQARFDAIGDTPRPIEGPPDLAV